MQTFNLTIATPDETVYQGEIISAIFPGNEGFFEVQANHAPIIAFIRQGTLIIEDSQKIKHSLEIKKGFFEFHKNKGILLSA